MIIIMAGKLVYSSRKYVGRFILSKLPILNRIYLRQSYSSDGHDIVILRVTYKYFKIRVANSAFESPQCSYNNRKKIRIKLLADSAY